jgi:hypothetical protein
VNAADYTEAHAIAAIAADVEARTGQRVPQPGPDMMRDATLDAGHLLATLGVGCVDADTGQPVAA